MKKLSQTIITTLGCFMGMGGIEHGIGEMLQGNAAPPALVFPSWRDAAFFSSVGGEPALSVIPNLFISGILAILFSLAAMAASFKSTQRKNGGLLLAALSLGMLLCGGGIFPPIICAVLGALSAAGSRMAKVTPLPISARSHRYLWFFWLSSFTLCFGSFVLLFPGTSVLAYFFDIVNDHLTLALLLIALATFLTSIAAVLLYERFSVKDDRGIQPDRSGQIKTVYPMEQRIS